MKMFNITINSCAQNRMVTFISRKGDREIVNEVRWFWLDTGIAWGIKIHDIRTRNRINRVQPISVINIEAHSHRAEGKMKAKIFFDVWNFFFDPFRWFFDPFFVFAFAFARCEWVFKAIHRFTVSRGWLFFVRWFLILQICTVTTTLSTNRVFPL